MTDSKPSSLFNHHLANLRSVCPATDDVFVCPICLSVFSSDTVFDTSVINLGHIWPGIIRNRSEVDDAKHQQILLCTSCNSKAGYRGDHEMQQFEIARQGDKSGTPTSQRQIWIRPKSNDPDIRMRAYFKSSEDHSSATLTFCDHPNAFKFNEKYRRYDEYARYQVSCDLIVYPHDANWQLAQAGWLTSAYLFAFYTFGYRYILHRSLDKVRHYILSSFEGDADRTLDFRNDKDLSVRTCNVHFSPIPLIMYMIPVIGTEQIHFLEVSFLDYHVRLPGRALHPVAQANEGEPDPEHQIAMESKGHVAHVERCHWDDLFDPVDYCVVGGEIVSVGNVQQ